MRKLVRVYMAIYVGERNTLIDWGFDFIYDTNFVLNILGEVEPESIDWTDAAR